MGWRAFQVLLTIFNIAFFWMAKFFIWKGGVTTPHSEPIEYKDLVAILLTGIAVMIAIAAVFLAVLAIWTYREAMTLIERVARETATPIATNVSTTVATA